MVEAKKTGSKKSIAKEVCSYKVFKLFTKYDKDNNCDASGIVSKECFQKWKESRKKAPKSAHEAFRRALTAHIRGVDGRRPFPEEVEASILAEVRKKKVWKCFEGSGCYIGVQGFPSLGFHESKSSGAKIVNARPYFVAEKKRGTSRKRMHEDSIWKMKPVSEVETFNHVNSNIDDDFFLSAPRSSMCFFDDTKLPPIEIDSETSTKTARVSGDLTPTTARRLSAFLASKVYGDPNPIFLEFDTMNELFELPICF
mmetsp:Transcript_16716/g.20626  ORF Transcript_16716/g.20626 Transcript_16716/m.20626 type:complete len:255 (-) Transcript_16716:476-1240(-)